MMYFNIIFSIFFISFKKIKIILDNTDLNIIEVRTKKGVIGKIELILPPILTRYFERFLKTNFGRDINIICLKK